jgi:hypothetical protein
MLSIKFAVMYSVLQMIFASKFEKNLIKVKIKINLIKIKIKI